MKETVLCSEASCFPCSSFRAKFVEMKMPACGTATALIPALELITVQLKVNMHAQSTHDIITWSKRDINRICRLDSIQEGRVLKDGLDLQNPKH